MLAAERGSVLPRLFRVASGDGPSAFEEVLRPLDLFEDLDDDELRRLARRFVDLEVPTHGVIAREGEEAAGFYVIRSGAVAVFRDAISKPVQLLARLGRGQYFGELSLYGGGRHSASVRASEPSRILRISRDDFLAFLAEHPATEQKFQHAAARRHAANVAMALEHGRRREVRFRCSHPVVLEMPNGAPRRAVLENLSLGGASLRKAPPEWRVGERVSFALGLREGQIHLVGRIAWRIDDTVGIAFIKTLANHDMIIQMAIRVLLELKRERRV